MLELYKYSQSSTIERTMLRVILLRYSERTRLNIFILPENSGNEFFVQIKYDYVIIIQVF